MLMLKFLLEHFFKPINLTWIPSTFQSIVTAQLNLNSSWSDYLIGWTTTQPHPPMKLHVVVVQLIKLGLET